MSVDYCSHVLWGGCLNFKIQYISPYGYHLQRGSLGHDIKGWLQKPDCGVEVESPKPAISIDVHDVKKKTQYCTHKLKYIMPGYPHDNSSKNRA